MKIFKCLEIAGALHDLAVLETAIEARIYNDESSVFADSQIINGAIRDGESTVRAWSGNSDTDSSRKVAERYIRNLRQPTRPITLGELQIEVRNLRETAFDELSRERGVMIHRQYAEYFDNGRSFGDTVSERFPSAVPDIRDAGNCLALGLNTASVFHAMRVAEYGLKSLARKVRVKLTDKNKPMPLTEATWGKIIQSLKAKIENTRQQPSSSRKRRDLEKWARLADHSDYLKDIWRNSASHSHHTYTAEEAETALLRVREFMRLLAT